MPNVNSQTIYQMGNVVNDIVKQATGRDAVQAIEMAHVTVEQNTVLGIETLSGSVVRFRTPKSVPLLTLEAQIVAQQNLHGYDYPWPAGGGKNMLPPSARTVTSNNIKYFADNTGIALKAGTYTISASEACNGIYVKQYSEGSNQAIETKYDSTFLTFTLSEDATGINFDFYNLSAGINPNMECQLEKGSTATAIAPYSNICPITGFTGCNITVSDGDTTEHVYPVEWETEAGTVYGGVLDAKNGKLTVDRIGYNVTISTSNTARNPTSVDGKYRFAITTNFENVILPETTGGLCGALFDKAKEITANETYNTQGTGMSVRNATTLIYYSEVTSGMTVSEFVTFIGESIQLILKLEEPVEYEVTPVAINTLAGDNVVSANTGDISLSYYVYSDLL